MVVWLMRALHHAWRHVREANECHLLSKRDHVVYVCLGSGCITMLESFDFRNHFCLVFDLLGMSMYDFLRCCILCHAAMSHFVFLPVRLVAWITNLSRG